MKVVQSCLTLCDPMDCSPWNSLGQNTAVGSLSLLQGIFPTQGATRANLHTIQRSNVKISAIKIPSLHLKKLSTSQQNFWDSLLGVLKQVKADTCTCQLLLPHLMVYTLSLVCAQVLLAPLVSSGHRITTSFLWPPTTISQMQPGFLSSYVQV